MARDMVQVRGKRSAREVPTAKVPRSQFNMSHQFKFTFDADYLIPILCHEILPGDTFTLRTNGFVRIFSPLKAPIMDNLYVDTFFFFIPERLIWTNFEKHMGAQEDPGDSIDYTIPYIAANQVLNQADDYEKFMDYIGCPFNMNTMDNPVNAGIPRSYNLVYNEWFRDQNLVNSVPNEKGDGPDNTPSSLYGLRKRAKRHDYFTSCLPWPQKQTLPVEAQFPVVGIGMQTTDFVTINQVVYETEQSATQTYANSKLVSDAAAGNQIYIEEGTGSNADRPAIFANVTINELRQAFQIQKLLERDARSGTRYTEILKSHFRVTSPDFRLQRPEYLGGASTPLNVSPVANTSATATEEQGHLAGIGTGGVRGGYAKSFTEHGFILGLINVRADLTYHQGLDRMYSRQTRYDRYWPSLALIGEQAVYNRELWIDNSANDALVFGYQERYGEYRRMPNRMAGLFRPDSGGGIDHWHVAEDFATRPVLNETFITSTTPMSRIQADTTGPDFLADIWFDYRAARPMPLYGVPGLIDHF